MKMRRASATTARALTPRSRIEWPLYQPVYQHHLTRVVAYVSVPPTSAIIDPDVSGAGVIDLSLSVALATVGIFREA